ncbi:hypothetical protein BD414DRAFT_496505 [Trametes punicea]|nr:hypothetical protein BD414DRAFT_496505 [Trametes punicea]
MQFSTIIKLALAVAQVGLVTAKPSSLEARQTGCPVSVLSCCSPTVACSGGATCIEIPLLGFGICDPLGL